MTSLPGTSPWACDATRLRCLTDIEMVPLCGAVWSGLHPSVRHAGESEMTTNGREVGSYIGAHVIGYAFSILLTSFVIVPLYTSTSIGTHAAGRYSVSFAFFAVVQVVVFGIFIAMRGRAGAPR